MRTKIREAIYRAARERSGCEALDTQTGFIADINGREIKLPCVWLCPLDLSGVTGRDAGFKTYSGVMYLMESVEGLTPEEKDAAWDRMEESALSILQAAADLSAGILPAENIRCEPDEYALTGYNTISITVRFDVKVKYCANRG